MTVPASPLTVSPDAVPSPPSKASGHLLPEIVLRRQLADEIARPIIGAVSLAWGMPIPAILSRSRTPSIFPARVALYSLLRAQGLSLALVAWAAGRKDHGSIVSGLRRAKHLYSANAEWQLLYVAARSLAGLLETEPT